MVSRLLSPAPELVSISIGQGADGQSTSIVLPSSHDLVRHLQQLLPQAAVAKTASVNHNDAVNTLASMTMLQHSGVSREYGQPLAHLHLKPISPTPASPCHSDSSSVSTTSANASSTGRGTGVRRRRAGAHSSGKECQMQGCAKISVSRGLCRGHGGGRRCQYGGCNKGAQSRSDFCWAHGGGQRCEVNGCMRSRKSKRFCVSHLSWEENPPSREVSSPTSAPTSTIETSQRSLMPKAPVTSSVPSTSSVPGPVRYARLPSLQQALLRHQCHSSVPRETWAPSTLAPSAGCL
ncbi:TPA: hypothetical protein N0F65_002793 [Lagenidium giganteum]|uniref:WRKY19-like zinc finger domain-containing protein n=1 Tax=Lagenidium giganteum TaxID=4803 RepID=A0AAV2YPM3_9STRA|nr:TPA: hypothetical protein N0F65_002793 [Lagenidium giganteum]